MKPNRVMLTISISTSTVATLLLTPIASLALPMDAAKPSEPNAGSQSVMKDTTERQPVTPANIERPSSSLARTERQQHVRRELGICRAYIPPGTQPDSYEYREGLEKCWYGSD
jgi:hypothetical protein